VQGTCRVPLEWHATEQFLLILPLRLPDFDYEIVFMKVALKLISMNMSMLNLMGVYAARQDTVFYRSTRTVLEKSEKRRVCGAYRQYSSFV